VRLENAAFSANNPDREILKGVSLTAEPGQMVAIVGLGTGSGKSTDRAACLFRFYDVNGGSQTIDRHGTLRNVTQSSSACNRQNRRGSRRTQLRFNDTIGYNIAYGRDGARKRGSPWQPRRAGTESTTLSSPCPMVRDVRGERGFETLGGLRSSVGIARTLLKHRAILLLGRGDQSLDSETERGNSGVALRPGSRGGGLADHCAPSQVPSRTPNHHRSGKKGEVVERGTH